MRSLLCDLIHRVSNTSELLFFPISYGKNLIPHYPIRTDTHVCAPRGCPLLPVKPGCCYGSRWLLFNFISGGRDACKRLKSLQHFGEGRGYRRGRRPSVASGIWRRHARPSSHFLPLPPPLRAPFQSQASDVDFTGQSGSVHECAEWEPQSCASRLMRFIFFSQLPICPP